MIDPFVLLTPILLLAVIALLRFVGCNQVFGLEPTVPREKVEERSVDFLLKPEQVLMSGDALNGMYLGLNFGVNQWRWEATPGYPGDIFFFDSTSPSRSFTIVNGGTLKSMLVFTKTDGQITLTDDQGESKTQRITVAAYVQSVITGWTQFATSVTVEFTPDPGGSPADLGIAKITYDIIVSS